MIKKKVNINKFGIILLFATLIVATFYLVNNGDFFKESLVGKVINNYMGKNVDEWAEWKEYNNEEPKFTMKYPSDLEIHDMGQSVHYYHFIRFEEKENSDIKGVGVGINETSVESEVDRIKEDFVTQGEGVLYEQKKFKIGELSGTMLHYKPKKESADIEEKSIAIFQNGHFAYSVSTVPGQIEKVLSGFKFN